MSGIKNSLKVKLNLSLPSPKVTFHLRASGTLGVLLKVRHTSPPGINAASYEFQLAGYNLFDIHIKFVDRPRPVNFITTRPRGLRD